MPHNVEVKFWVVRDSRIVQLSVTQAVALAFNSSLLHTHVWFVRPQGDSVTALIRHAAYTASVGTHELNAGRGSCPNIQRIWAELPPAPPDRTYLRWVSRPKLFDRIQAAGRSEDIVNCTSVRYNLSKLYTCIVSPGVIVHLLFRGYYVFERLYGHRETSKLCHWAFGGCSAGRGKLHLMPLECHF
jgi:hypothetical protein